MRTTFLSVAILLYSTTANAQITAGEVPAGMSAVDVNIDLALNSIFTADSASLELDCDDFLDAWAILVRGYPGVDVPNYAMLRFVDTDMEVCADMAPGLQQRPKYHAFGEPLDCAGDFDWQSETFIELGDFGSLAAIGPNVTDSMYIAYRSGGTIGWILLSFDLTEDAEITMQVHRVLATCPGATSIEQNARNTAVTLFPNPSNGEAIRLDGANALRSIEVLDATGRSLARYNGTARTIAAPETAGAYIVSVTHLDGRRSMTRLVRD